MRKPKPPCKTCDHHAGGGLDYCYTCLGAMLDRGAPWQPQRIDATDLPSVEAYRPRAAQLARKATA
jgi:hypothetical protein